MSRWLRHRYGVFLPIAVLFLAAWLGGYVLNTIDAQGTVIDDSSGEAVPDIDVTYGSRKVTAGSDGRYYFPNLPRGARLGAQKQGYARGSASADASELRLMPVSLTFQVNQESSTPPQGVPFPKVRLGDKEIGSGTESGSVVAFPYPEKGMKVLICAAGYDGKEIEPKGPGPTEVVLHKNTDNPGCPPLPTPSPRPTPSPTGSAAPTPSPTASP